MALNRHSTSGQNVVDETLQQKPGVTFSLAQLRRRLPWVWLALLASTFIASMWIASWWGDEESPIVIFPFLGLFYGLAQFIAGIFGFWARDTLVGVM